MGDYGEYPEVEECDDDNEDFGRRCIFCRKAISECEPEDICEKCKREDK